MNWRRASEIGKLPFRFKKLTAVVTGTTQPKSPLVQENQWDIPKRD